MARPPTDEALWSHVRDQAAIHGWDDRQALISGALDRLRKQLPTDAAREDARGRLDRQWAETMSIMGAV